VVSAPPSGKFPPPWLKSLVTPLYTNKRYKFRRRPQKLGAQYLSSYCLAKFSQRPWVLPH